MNLQATCKRGSNGRANFQLRPTPYTWRTPPPENPPWYAKEDFAALIVG